MRYKVSDIADIINVSVKNPSTSGIDVFVGLEHYDVGEPVITRYGSTEMLTTTVKSFQSGDILLARRNVYLRRAGKVDFDGVTSGDSIVIRVKENLSYLEECDSSLMKSLLPFILNTNAFWDYANTNSDGTMSKRLSPQMLLDYEFDMPPIEEQKVLADKLWAAYRLKESYKKLLAATEEMVKSQFIEMFGDPSIDTKWPTKKLKELGSLDRGVSKARPRNAPELLGGAYPLIQTGDITEAKLYIKDYHQTYSELGLAQSKMWKRGTLCITIAANIAQTAILDIDACFPDSVVGFIPNDVEIIFIHYWFSFIQQVLERQAPQTAQKNINLKTLSELDVIVPPKDLQSQFVNIVLQADKSGFELRKSIDAIDAVIKSLINN